MLNELILIERGARAAGVAMARRHPDVMKARRVPTLLVRLTASGNVADVRPVPSTLTPWTLRDGKHNSFPFVQPKHPLWITLPNDPRREAAIDKKGADRRQALISLASEVQWNSEGVDGWPSSGLLKRLRERRIELSSLEHTDAAAVPMSIERFILACDQTAGGGAQRLMHEIVDTILVNLRTTPEEEWVAVAIALLLDGNGALVFDTDDGRVSSILAPHIPDRVSDALEVGRRGEKDRGARCALSGETVALVTGNFPQPNLPGLGETYLFTRNKDAPANSRYGCYAANTMPVGQDTAIRLAAALTALTAPDLQGKTWRFIPSEASQQRDLLLAFVDAVTAESLADVLTNEDEDEDFSEEIVGSAGNAGSIAAFEKRCERVITSLQAADVLDFRATPVRVIVLRKVDPANRKVVYAQAPTIAGLYNAAMDWTAGERNVPPWLTLPVLPRGQKRVRAMRPPHIAPLGLIGFSKQLFLREGAERQEVKGIPASEALALFLNSDTAPDHTARERIRRALRLVLARRSVLVERTAHALRKGFDEAKHFDRREALRTVTMLGVLLHKDNRANKQPHSDEEYMDGTAFRLGQLLAAADVVHVGYCADMRGGDVPPSLLGNQVFTMAQTTPAKALAVLSRRWKTYDGWARRTTYLKKRAKEMVDSKRPDEQQRGWAIRTALRHARNMRTLANNIAPAVAELDRQAVDDVFRAELLLGYIAGLPKVQKEDGGDENENAHALEQEG